MIQHNSTCFACGRHDLHTVLNLGYQPLANSYLKNVTDGENRYPLELCFCPVCTHLQLSHTVDPSELFENYLYVSGTSKTLRDYFDQFPKLVQNYTKGTKVLDIACNDGSQLDSFKAIGYDTYGIDPAKNLYQLSAANHKVICDYLTKDNILDFGVKFDVIIAQNVLAHNNYPKEFLEYCKSALAPGGRIFIQTSQANMVANNEFDTVYHEHLSFFSIKSFCTLAARAGLKTIDIQKTPVHGVSFVFVLSNDEKDADNSEKLIAGERELTLEVMKEYAVKAGKVTEDLKNTITKYKQLGYTVVGFGAAAKGNTLLNYGSIIFDYIVDDNPLKQGLFTPGMRIPIAPPDVLSKETGKLLIVPLAWNFYQEIKEKVQQRAPHATFVRYFPELHIE